MTSKQKSLRRLGILYIVFFVVILASITLSFHTSSLSEGFVTGMNDAQRMYDEGHGRGRKVEIIYDLRAATGHMDFNMPVFEKPDGSLSLHMRPSKIDVEAISNGTNGLPKTGLALTFGILSVLVYAAIFVAIFMILASLRRSIRTDTGFERSNVIRTRLIGVLLIAASLLFSLASWIECRAVAPYFADSAFSISTSFPFNFTEIVTGVLILVIAEVFVIGNSLSEEQKLTI